MALLPGIWSLKDKVVGAAAQAGAASRGRGAHPHEHQPCADHLPDGPDARLVWLPGALLRLERPRRAEAPGARPAPRQLACAAAGSAQPSAHASHT